MLVGFITSFFSDAGQWVFYIIGLLFWGTALAVLMGGL